jgi:hypothetical protein
MFFSIVIPLSAFGRLILHTGAMSQKPILSEELEKDLLPSGLQASLLIRAMDRQRRNTEVTAQYRRRQQRNTTTRAESAATATIPQGNSQDDSLSIEEQQRIRIMPIFSQPTTLSPNKHRRFASVETIALPKASILNATTSRKELYDLIEGQQSTWKKDDLDEKAITPQPMKVVSPSKHRRFASTETIDFPQASVLNATTSRKELHELIDSTISAKPRNDMEQDWLSSGDQQQPLEADLLLAPSFSSNKTQSPRPSLPKPPTIQNHRRVSSTRLMMEWAEETDVRDLYGAAPPADLPHPDGNMAATMEGSFRFSDLAFWNQSPHPQHRRHLSSMSMDLSPTVFSDHTTTTHDVNPYTATQRLTQPLLPDLDDDEDGVLHGEHLLSPRRPTKASFKPDNSTRK